MRSLIYLVIFSSLLFLAVSATEAASVYLWTDESGRIHITDRPPQKSSQVRDVIEYEPRPASQLTEPAQRTEAAESTDRDKEEGCRNVFEARRTLRKTKTVAAAVRSRAQEARDKVEELRDRIGFDDDERDDFKDDLKRLEQNARRAELFARQAELDVQAAELQVKMAESEAGKQCADEPRF